MAPHQPTAHRSPSPRTDADGRPTPARDLWPTAVDPVDPVDPADHADPHPIASSWTAHVRALLTRLENGDAPHASIRGTNVANRLHEQITEALIDPAAPPAAVLEAAHWIGAYPRQCYQGHTLVHLAADVLTALALADRLFACGFTDHRGNHWSCASWRARLSGTAGDEVKWTVGPGHVLVGRLFGSPPQRGWWRRLLGRPTPVPPPRLRPDEAMDRLTALLAGALQDGTTPPSPTEDLSLSLREASDKRARWSREQFPLVIATALLLHKSDGTPVVPIAWNAAVRATIGTYTDTDHHRFHNPIHLPRRVMIFMSDGDLTKILPIAQRALDHRELEAIAVPPPEADPSARVPPRRRM